MYRRSYLPAQPLAELAAGDIEKVTWVAFGSTINSWFFAYAFEDGTTTFRLGKGVPGPLREYVDRFGKPTDLEGTLHVQLGHANSFVAWSKTAWACSGNVPDELRKRLCALSSSTRVGQNITMGSLKKGTLINAQWNMDGSYYLETTHANDRQFRSAMLTEAWWSLWPGLEKCIIEQAWRRDSGKRTLRR
jgi:methylenetetrahydrofolate dehydrogenase (NADP+)/methenyltetrahydrofolate cyclohydrolase/formyltetrahydrofolate synthetase